jgi:hypothetical protein
MPHSHDRSAKPDRRSVVLAGAALVAAAAVPDAGTRAAEVGLATAADLLARVNQFLSSLEPEQRKMAEFAWDGPEWRGWNYFAAATSSSPAEARANERLQSCCLGPPHNGLGEEWPEKAKTS